MNEYDQLMQKKAALEKQALSPQLIGRAVRSLEKAGPERLLNKVTGRIKGDTMFNGPLNPITINGRPYINAGSNLRHLGIADGTRQEARVATELVTGKRLSPTAEDLKDWWPRRFNSGSASLTNYTNALVSRLEKGLGTRISKQYLTGEGPMPHKEALEAYKFIHNIPRPE